MIKKILIFGGLALILAGGGGYAYLFLFKKGGGHAEAAATEGAEGAGEDALAAESHSAEPPPPKPTPVATVASNAPGNDYDYDYSSAQQEDEETEITAANQTHIINLPAATRGARAGFLKCQFSILVRDPELGKKIASDTPTPEREESRAIIFDILSTISADEALDTEMRLTIRQDIMDRLNERFRPRVPAAADKGKDKNAPQRPVRPIKDVLVIEWAVQR